MKLNDTLTSIGLSRDEAAVYMTLLEFGPSSPTDIERHAKLYRPLVYKALASLTSRHLIVISPKGKRKVYVAESPDKLTEMFSKIEHRFLASIEDLHALFANPKSAKPVVTYTEGDQAIRDSFMDVIESLPAKDTYYRYSPGYQLFEKDRFLPKRYREIRDKKNLERFVIVNDDGKKPRQRLGKEIKKVPRSFDLFNDRIGQVIYGNKVLVIDYDTQTAITITHPKFAEFQKKIFKLLYGKL